jgi:hypothetical protein
MMLTFIEKNPNLSSTTSIDVYHREDVAIYYESVKHAIREQLPGRERHFDKDRDVCPQTGAVFRDSGLRGRAKDLYRQITTGAVRGCRLIRIVGIDKGEVNFSDYDHIIQALGSSPNVPPLEIGGQVVWHGTGTDLFEIEYDGRVEFVRTIPANWRPPLFALRVLPTPICEKDRRPEVHDVHRRLATAVMTSLAEVEANKRIGSD